MNDPALWWILAAYAFTTGALIGSFLNVVIWRVPRGESIVSPPSHCPKCNAPIRWYQNIPILAWLALRGKCANCKAPISPRYILIEILGGILFLAAFWRYGVFAPLAWVWISLMIIGSFIDFDLKLLPDFVTIGGIVYGIGVSLVFYAIVAFTPYHFHNFAFAASDYFLTPVDSILGAALGFGLLWLVRFLGSKAFKREAMGMGDVILLSAIGANSGWAAVLFTLFASSILGSIGGVITLAIARRRPERFVEIPYGPYLCLGALAWMFYGVEIFSWYTRLLGVHG